MSVEQERRDLKEANPDLYAYIAAWEAARVLDSAGDIVSGAGSGEAAANRVWAMAHRYKTRAGVLEMK